MENLKIELNKVDSISYLLGSVSSYCYMVLNGKPVASVAIEEKCKDEAISIIKDIYNLNYIISKDKNDKDSLTVWIYKHPHLKEIIEIIIYIFYKRKEYPITNFDHWILGKLYGYDEDSIAEFLKKL